MKSVWNISEIYLTDGMRISIDSYFRAHLETEKQYACIGLMNHIKKYLIDIDKKE